MFLPFLDDLVFIAMSMFLYITTYQYQKIYQIFDSTEIIYDLFKGWHLWKGNSTSWILCSLCTHYNFFESFVILQVLETSTSFARFAVFKKYFACCRITHSNTLFKCWLQESFWVKLLWVKETLINQILES